MPAKKDLTMPPQKTYPEIYSEFLRPAEQLYIRRLLKNIYQYFQKGNKVLDAGCGDGRLAEILHEKGCQVTAVDIEAFPDSWERLKQKQIACYQASAEELPFADAAFDAVFIKDAFHHMQNPVKAMSELLRVTRAGGPIVVIEANRYNPVFYLHLTLFGNHQHFTRKYFHEFLKAADANYKYLMEESRCLPWDTPWVLNLLDGMEDAIARTEIFRPWVTYQIGIVKGQGRQITRSAMKSHEA